MAPLTIRPPRLDDASHSLEVEQLVAHPPGAVYAAWTTGWERWFAAPGSLLMRPEVNAPFFFETEFRFALDQPADRHPHYGRFLRLDPDRLVELTWVTGPSGTGGVETVVTVELTPVTGGTLVRLCHAGFADTDTRDRTRLVWPYVLEQMERRLADPAAES